MTRVLSEATAAAVSAVGLGHRLYLSSDAKAPLCVLIHGRAGNAGVVSPFFNMLPEDISVFCPQAWLADPLGGWSWWQVQASASEGPEMEESLQKLLNAVERFRLYYQLSPRMHIGAGFSQGAALLSLALQKCPSLFSAAILMAGFVPPWKGARGSHMKVLLLHGEQDAVVPLFRAKESSEYLTQLGFEVEMVTDPVAHKVGSGGMRRFKEFVREILAHAG